MHARLSIRERPEYFWNGFNNRTMGRDELSSNFQGASANKTIILSQGEYLVGVPLLAPIKAVIGDCSPSSRALLLRTQMLVSHANIITWDVFLQSLLSCLTLVVVYIEERIATPTKAVFQSRIPLQVLTYFAVSHKEV